MTQIDQEGGQHQGDNRRPGRPELDGNELGCARIDQSAHQQRLGEADVSAASKHPEDGAVGRNADRERQGQPCPSKGAAPGEADLVSPSAPAPGAGLTYRGCHPWPHSVTGKSHIIMTRRKVSRRSVTGQEVLLVTNSAVPIREDGLEPGGRAPAPGGLRLVQAFVNTVDLEDGPDLLATPDGLRQWLAEENLPGHDRPLREADLQQVVAVREALRSLAAANNGEPVDPATFALLNEVGADAGVAVRFDATADPQLAQFTPGSTAPSASSSPTPTRRWSTAAGSA